MAIHVNLDPEYEDRVLSRQKRNIIDVQQCLQSVNLIEVP